MKQSNLRQILILISLAILFGGSSIAGLGSATVPLSSAMSVLRYVLIVIGLSSLLYLSQFNLYRFRGKAIPFLVLWFAFSLALLLSGFANDDWLLLRNGFWLMLVVPLSSFNALPNLMKEHTSVLIAGGLVLGHVPYIALSFWLHPLSTEAYTGVFANPNQMGLTCVTMAAGMFTLLVDALFIRKSIIYGLLVSFFLLLVFALILSSSSRTSLFAFLIMFIIMIGKLFLRRKTILTLISTLLTVICVGLLFPAEQLDLLWGRAEQSLTAKHSGDALLSGREDIWSKTLDDADLFGHGTDYFDVNFGLGAHNEIISTLGQSGSIAAFFVICLLVASVWYCAWYFIRYTKQDPHAIMPLMITACFWTISMGESTFGSFGLAITLAYMLSMGIVVTKVSTEKISKGLSS